MSFFRVPIPVLLLIIKNMPIAARGKHNRLYGNNAPPSGGRVVNWSNINMTPSVTLPPTCPTLPQLQLRHASCEHDKRKM